MTSILAALVGLLLAAANGANDNFKGVATLFGSGTTSYRAALIFATISTALGSLLALVLARGLLVAFSGRGLVPAALAADPAFPAAVALAAGLTVLAATRVGLPISTTHALLGGLVGVALVAAPTQLDGDRLVGTFLLPLLTSPVLAVAATALLYPALRWARLRLGVQEETCVCIGSEIVAIVPGAPGRETALALVRLPIPTTGVLPPGASSALALAVCTVRPTGELFGVSARRLLDGAHFVSAGAVSFARGLNDTGKIAALLLVGGVFVPSTAIAATALAIAEGGWLGARRVAETVSLRVTTMNAGQGFTANLVTAALVIGASRLGMPVSTTHVSIGALFGIGAVTGQARWGAIGGIVLAWVVTLPVAALLGAVAAVALGV